MKVTIKEFSLPKEGAVVVTALNEGRLAATGSALDKACGGALKRAIRANDFKGQRGQWLEVLAPAGGAFERIVVYGLGEARHITDLTWQNLGGNVAQKLATSGCRSVTVIAETAKNAKIAADEAAANVAYGAQLGGYRFTKYHGKKAKDDKRTLRNIAVTVADATAARRRHKVLSAIAEGISMTRDLVSEPPNVLYPASLAAECKTLSKLGVTVEVLGEARMEKLGMGALLGVGQGSRRESQLVVMRWDGGTARQKPVAFVGKGVTFDTGGISLKPGPGMEQMKWDMGGSGTVIGLMKALAGRKAKTNVVGVVGLVENMPDGNAQRPGDIVTSMSGQTIEIHNTDAEGRLVLADALWYTQDRFKPQFMIDLATLTGAMIIALGHENAGLFSNNDALAERMAKAAKAVDEGVWRMPMSDAYDKKINCDIADMKNIGGRDAGSITAAQFLKRFVNDVPWAHLDIAGTAWSEKSTATTPKGGVGWGVRMLDRLVADNYTS
jgi:leucyl aminopeptidase